MVKRKTCVFISGRGSNLKNLIFHSRDNNFPIKISLIISNNKNAYGINYAKKFQIPYIIINTKLRNYENKILFSLKKYNITFICLAGYMKIISNSTITQKSFFIDSKDNELLLKKKTQILEYQAFPEAVIKIFRNN